MNQGQGRAYAQPQVWPQQRAAPRRKPLFKSFFAGGFECSTHRTRTGRRLDVIAATGHDQHARADYARLREMGIKVARDGLRWHLIETLPGQYDFRSVRPLVEAARAHGVQVIWDVFHYGWPDDLELFSAAFIDRLAGLARAFARLLTSESDETPWLVPVNEISFFSWAAGDEGFFYPYARGRGDELKRHLVRAQIAAIDAVREVAPNARFVHTDPLVNVVARPEQAHLAADAESYRQAQYEAWDMLSGRLEPGLGGADRYLDVLGLNYYPHNQWFYPDRVMIPFGASQYRPLREMLHEAWERYQRPLFLAETGVENEMRPDWLRYVSNETRSALTANVPIEGICLYPIVNHPGWDDDRHCHNGLWDYADEAGLRQAYEPLARELRGLIEQLEQRADVSSSPWHLACNFPGVMETTWPSNRLGNQSGVGTAPRVLQAQSGYQRELDGRQQTGSPNHGE